MPDSAIAPLLLGMATEADAAPLEELSLMPFPELPLPDLAELPEPAAAVTSPVPAAASTAASMPAASTPVATVAVKTATPASAAKPAAPTSLAKPVAAESSSKRGTLSVKSAPAAATTPVAAPAAVTQARSPGAKASGIPAATTAAVPSTATDSSASASAAAAAAPTQAMDRDFIARNQIVERYISGRLPIKGATEFERFCTDNPGLLDELGLPERVNAGLRLLEAAGKPEPWQEAPKKFWEKPHLAIGLGVATLALIIALAVVWSGSSVKTARVAKLQKQVAEQPLDPATTTRTVRLLPNYKGSSNSPAVILGAAGGAQLADLKIDLSRSAYRSFRVTIDRIDQGRVAILHNLDKDSNGHVHIALNTSALGPGNYQFTIEGMTWKGEAVPDAWLTIGLVH